MANIKSAKKRVITNELRRQRNVSRRSEVKTAVKKVIQALDSNDVGMAKTLLKTAEGKIARAQGKGIFKKSTASHKISKLAKKVALALKSQA